MTIDTLMLVVGRLLLGGLFVTGGLRRLKVMKQALPVIQARGIPAPYTSLIVATGFQILLGGLFIAGFFIFFVALGLAAFTLAASWVVFDFWNKNGPERTAGVRAWEANFAIIGGLLIAASGT